MKVLVTGGAGFIGSHLVEGLLARGDAVRIFDDLSSGRREHLEGPGGDLEVVLGDVRDLDALRGAARGCDAVLHEGALPSVKRSVEDPRLAHDVNATGTLNVLVAARDVGVRRVVFASSSAVYGESAALPKVETMPPEPVSPYAAQKLAGERYCAIFHGLYGLETVALRYFNIFGPRQDPRSEYAAVVPRFVTALLRGQRPTVFGDGEQSRDFTYVANVVAANLRALEAPAAALGRAFNVACGERYTLNALLDAIRRETGRDLAATYEAPRPGDIRHSQAGIELARAVLGYEPAVSFEEGIRRTVAWYRERLGRER